MRFGTVVVITRGGGSAAGQPGCTRQVLGKVVGARGCNRRVLLLEDDPLDTTGLWRQAGDVGWWAATQLEEV